MKKIYRTMMCALAALSLAACGSDKPDVPNNGGNNGGNTATDGVEVGIATSEIQTKANVALEFKGNDKMNVFAKTYGRIDAPNIVDNVVATYDGSKWTLSPAVKINDQQKNAFVYAVAPYDASYTDPAKIPVDLSKQIDLLYSGSYVPASLTSPNVKLTMKHALSLLTFNIVPVNYSGSGDLKKVSINGDIVYSTASLDASTGKITAGQKGTIDVSLNKKIAAGGWKSDIPGVWAIPFNTKQGNVNVAITIDSKTYDLILPEVEMKQGYQYIFRLALTNNGLEFDPSKTETISLNVSTDEAQEFAGFGCIVLKSTGSTMHSPVFTGDAVFGTIATASKHMPYSPNASIEGVGAGQSATIESWNSSGFKFESLDGIDTIDLSQYE